MEEPNFIGDIVREIGRHKVKVGVSVFIAVSIYLYSSVTFFRVLRKHNKEVKCSFVQLVNNKTEYR